MDDKSLPENCYTHFYLNNSHVLLSFLHFSHFKQLLVICGVFAGCSIHWPMTKRLCLTTWKDFGIPRFRQYLLWFAFLSALKFVNVDLCDHSCMSNQLQNVDMAKVSRELKMLSKMLDLHCLRIMEVYTRFIFVTSYNL